MWVFGDDFWILSAEKQASEESKSTDSKIVLHLRKIWLGTPYDFLISCIKVDENCIISLILICILYFLCLAVERIICTLKSQRLKITQLEKAHFIKANELKLTRVILVFSLYGCCC